MQGKKHRYRETELGSIIKLGVSTISRMRGLFPESAFEIVQGTNDEESWIDHGVVPATKQGIVQEIQFGVYELPFKGCHKADCVLVESYTFDFQGDSASTFKSTVDTQLKYLHDALTSLNEILGPLPNSRYIFMKLQLVSDGSILNVSEFDQIFNPENQDYHLKFPIKPTETYMGVLDSLNLSLKSVKDVPNKLLYPCIDPDSDNATANEDSCDDTTVMEGLGSDSSFGDLYTDIDNTSQSDGDSNGKLMTIHETNCSAESDCNSNESSCLVASMEPRETRSQWKAIFSNSSGSLTKAKSKQLVTGTVVQQYALEHELFHVPTLAEHFGLSNAIVQGYLTELVNTDVLEMVSSNEFRKNVQKTTADDGNQFGFEKPKFEEVEEYILGKHEYDPKILSTRFNLTIRTIRKYMRRMVKSGNLCEHTTGVFSIVRDSPPSGVCDRKVKQVREKPKFEDVQSYVLEQQVYDIKKLTAHFLLSLTTVRKHLRTMVSLNQLVENSANDFSPCASLVLPMKRKYSIAYNHKGFRFHD